MKKATSSEAWTEEMWAEQNVEFAYDDELEYGYTQDGDWNTPSNVANFKKLSEKVYQREVVENSANIRAVWRSWFRRFDSIGEQIKVKCGALLAKVTWLELECNRVM